MLHNLLDHAGNGLIIFCILLSSCTSEPEILRTSYLDAADQVGAWLITQADGQNPIPDVAGDTTFSASLGSGAAGRALFFLELFNATQDSSYLAWAKSESDVVLELSQTAVERGDLRAGLYNGVAGNIFTLSEMGKFGEDNHYQDALPGFILLLAEKAREEIINDVIVGAAGMGLVLLRMAESRSDTLLAYASAIGDTLLRRGIPEGEGTYWKRAENMDFNLPNFSHGAAGVGYFLARLYETTREQTYLAGAERAARYLMDVADREDGLFLVPYGIPNEGFTTQYDIGWAHGPPGTARLFYLLWKLTKNEMYRTIADAHVRSIETSGVPGITTDSIRWTGPFRIDQRFGTSGAATFLLKLHRTTGDVEQLSLARELVDDLLQKSHYSEAGRNWVLPKYGFQGDRGAEASYTGYFYGAAGIGLALLEMHYIDINQAPHIIFPDEPFSDH